MTRAFRSLPFIFLALTALPAVAAPGAAPAPAASAASPAPAMQTPWMVQVSHATIQRIDMFQTVQLPVVAVESLSIPAVTGEAAVLGIGGDTAYVASVQETTTDCKPADKKTPCTPKVDENYTVGHIWNGYKLSIGILSVQPDASGEGWRVEVMATIEKDDLNGIKDQKEGAGAIELPDSSTQHLQSTFVLTTSSPQQPVTLGPDGVNQLKLVFSLVDTAKPAAPADPKKP